jgi:dephospho-CoA kinase
MIVIGLTGSIGMGKSTTAALFKAAGVPVHDSDAAVHAFYAGPGVPVVEAAFPGVVADGRVDRARLSAQVVNNPDAMRRLEAIVHPVVGEARERFLKESHESGAPVVVMDIPLLFEIGGDAHVDVITVVSAPPDIQRARVLARSGMNAEKFEGILARQIPDAEKRRRAHFIIDTSHGVETARRRVDEILRAVAAMQPPVTGVGR